VRGEELWFLTAKHNLPPHWITSPGGAMICIGRVVAMHPVLDIQVVAFIMPEPTPPPLIELRFEQVPVGMVTFVSGWGGGQEPWFTIGQFSGDDRISNPISPGDSGGAVLDSEGYLRGIVVGKCVDHSSHSYFVPLSLAKDWLEPLLDGH
jgi:hypothetical protein